MKAIMISIKPKWCAKIMNVEKTIEVRKNKTLANAIQNLIDENGYADIYVYCSKNEWLLYKNKTENEWDTLKLIRGHKLSSTFNGKVVFKFRCYKVEEITPKIWTPQIGQIVLEKSCLAEHELFDYICSHIGAEDKPFYAIHISDLEIFGKPKELREFKKINVTGNCWICELFGSGYLTCSLTKAPQNFCYIEEN